MTIDSSNVFERCSMHPNDRSVFSRQSDTEDPVEW